MTNNNRLIDAFCSALGIEADSVIDSLKYNTIEQWDSTAHMILISELEDSFEVMFDTDEIIDMSSVSKARKTLQKHGVDFDT